MERISEMDNETEKLYKTVVSAQPRIKPRSLDCRFSMIIAAPPCELD